MGKLIDLTGQRFERLEVLKRAPKPDGATSTSAFWLCKCDCGTEKIISGNVLKQGKAKSCGCLASEKRDKDSLIGKVFERLTVIERAERPQGVKGGDAYWLCECECGKKVVVMGKSLKSGKTKSCGCYKRDLIRKDLTGLRFGKLVAVKPEGISNDGYILWRCECDCGNIHVASSNNLQYGQCNSCGCLISQGENEIEKILLENKINFIKQYSFQDLRGPKGGLLRFDFAVLDEENKVKYLIEFQGEQHYNYSGSFFDQPLETDCLKKEYCELNNLKLILIPYWKRGRITLSDLTQKERYGSEEE